MKSYKDMDKLPSNQFTPILYLLYRKQVISEDELIGIARYGNGAFRTCEDMLIRIDKITGVN